MDKTCCNCQHRQPIKGCENVKGRELHHDVIRPTDCCKDDFKAVEPKKVYLIYEGDEHLSKSSLMLMGVFDSKANLMTGATELVTSRVNDNWDGIFDENA